MKNSLFILASVIALSLASCSQEKATEVTTTPVAANGTTTTTTSTSTSTTTTAPESEAVIEARAQRIADKMVANMKISDAATKTKIRTVYVERAKRMNEVKTKYATDTTGMAAATREAVANTDAEFKTIFVDPTQYQAYESSRSTYDDSNYMDDKSISTPDNVSTDAMSSGTATDNTMSTDAMGATKIKAKYEDGSKLKVKENGKMKIKDADGAKIKN